MRTKFVRNSRTNRRELLIASQRGETLAGKLADRLVDDPSALLLGFAYEKQRGGGALLHYDVDGLWSLRTYLAKRALGVDEVRGLLEATQGVLDLCAEQHLRTEGLLFDPEFVFVDAQCCPHFALVPLDDMPFEARNSPLALLAPLGDTDKLRFSSPDAEGVARRLGDLVLDLEGVFSANRFRRFVRDEQRQGEGAVPEARRSVVDPSTSSVWATAGATSEQPAADSSSLFWSPLVGFAEEEVAPAASVAEPAPAASVQEHAAVPTPASPSTSSVQEQLVWQPVSQPLASADGEFVVTKAPEASGGVASGFAGAVPFASANAYPQAPEPRAENLGAPAWPGPMTAMPTPESPSAMSQAPSSVAQGFVSHAASSLAQSATSHAAPSAAQGTATPAAPSATQPSTAQPAGVVLVRLATGERIALPVGIEAIAGRGSSCSIRLRGNPKISRMHVALIWTGQMLMVRDLGAVNGVWANGRRLAPQQPATITPGQRLRLADEEFEIQNA